jgi:hypothetical protein
MSGRDTPSALPPRQSGSDRELCRARVFHEALHRKASPLRTGVVRDGSRNGIAIQDQPMEHERQLRVGNRPLWSNRGATGSKEGLRHLEQSLRALSSSWREWRARRRIEHGVGRTFIAKGFESRAEKGHHLPNPSTLLAVGRKQRLPVSKGFVQVLDDRGRFPKPESVVDQGGNLAGD